MFSPSFVQLKLRFSPIWVTFLIQFYRRDILTPREENTRVNKRHRKCASLPTRLRKYFFCCPLHLVYHWILIEQLFSVYRRGRSVFGGVGLLFLQRRSFDLSSVGKKSPQPPTSPAACLNLKLVALFYPMHWFPKRMSTKQHTPNLCLDLFWFSCQSLDEPDYPQKPT